MLGGSQERSCLPIATIGSAVGGVSCVVACVVARKVGVVLGVVAAAAAGVRADGLSSPSAGQGRSGLLAGLPWTTRPCCYTSSSVWVAVQVANSISAFRSIQLKRSRFLVPRVAWCNRRLANIPSSSSGSRDPNSPRTRTVLLATVR